MLQWMEAVGSLMWLVHVWHFCCVYLSCEWQIKPCRSRTPITTPKKIIWQPYILITQNKSRWINSWNNKTFCCICIDRMQNIQNGVDIAIKAELCGSIMCGLSLPYSERKGYLTTLQLLNSETIQQWLYCCFRWKILC